MSLIATLNPSTYVLAGNPLKLSVQCDGMCSYKVYVGTQLVYDGRMAGNSYVFIQDIIEPYLHSQVFYNSDARLIIPATGNGLSCSVVVECSEDVSTINFKAYLGGVSRSVLRSIGQGNIFTDRFLTSSGNIFFSLRSESDLLLIRETEISPLLFIYPSSGTLSVRCNGESITLAGTAGALYALNIEAIRKAFFADYDFIGSFFEILKSNSLVISIGITPSSVSKDRYYLRYLNSLGAYEVIECSGSAEREAEFDDDCSYDVYDPVVDGYVRKRDRRRSRQTVSVHTGLIDEERLILYQDLLSSEDVTLLGYHGCDHKVVPQCDDLTAVIRGARPPFLTIRLTLCDDDDHLSSDDIDRYLGDGRVHTPEFTEQFN